MDLKSNDSSPKLLSKDGFAATSTSAVVNFGAGETSRLSSASNVSSKPKRFESAMVANVINSATQEMPRQDGGINLGLSQKQQL